MSVRIAKVRESPHKSIEVLVVIVMLLIALPSALSAQQELPEQKPLRFDLSPFIGYRTSMSFPVEPHVTGMNPRVILDATPSYGVSLGMRLANEGDLVEMRWARQDSYAHAEDITPHFPRQRVILDQFHAARFAWIHNPDGYADAGRGGDDRRGCRRSLLDYGP